MSAESIAAAVESLRGEGKYPTSLVPANQNAARGGSFFSRGPRMGRKDVLQFAGQLQIMIETGVTLSEALESIAGQSTKPGTRAVLLSLCRDVQSGSSFSNALSQHTRTFPRMLITLIAASEKSGQMAKMLGRAVQYLRDEQETIRKVRGALTYPAVMMAFAISTTCFLMTGVLPKFTAIYASKGASLPAITRFLMAVSAFLIHDWPWIIVAVGGFSVGLWKYRQMPQGRRMLDYLQLRVPLFGSVFQKLHLSRGLRLIGTMAGSGISLPDSVRNAYELSPNIYFRDLWSQVGAQIQTGKQFSEPLFQSPLVPKSLAQMLHSAEKGGRLAPVMEQLAGFAETELKEKIQDMTRYIEPAMIAFMGVIIGTVALALMLPIFTISKVIAK
jgi:type IV pilus assembly protein PilC